MEIMIKKVGQEAVLVKDWEHSYENMKKIVGGYIECVSLPHGIDMWLNEEGLLEQLPLNLQTSMNGQVVHVIVGDVFFAGHDGEGETIGLTSGQQKFIRERLTSDKLLISGHGMYKVHEFKLYTQDVG